MAAGPEESLFQEARAIHGQEFDTWATTLLNVLQSRDRSTTCLTYLRQLLVLTSVTKYNRNLSSNVFRMLRSMVLEPEQGPSRLRLLAAAILRELSPLQKTLVRDFTPPTDPQNIPFILPVLLAQVLVREQPFLLIPHVFKWLTHPGVEEELCITGLCCLHSLCNNSKALEWLTEDKMDILNNQLTHWLRHASKTSLMDTGGISLFSSSNKKQLVAVKEIDGSISQDIFTILSIGDYYSVDQLLNIHTFSLLRLWVRTTSTGGVANHSHSPTPTPESLTQEYSSPVSDHRSNSLVSSTSSSHSPLFSSLTSRPTRSHSIREIAIQYCLRVIDQCERKPTKSFDEDLIKACLYEAISLLDLLCSLHRRYTHSVFQTIRKLFNQLSDEDGYHRVLLALTQFFINHGQSEMYSYEPAVKLFFNDILSTKFSDSCAAYDAIEYCITNQQLLCDSTHTLTRYFPNLLKVLAWFPTTFIAEFIQLLPSFITETTASEVFHSLCDLPCLAAVLTANYIATLAPVAVDQNLVVEHTTSLSALQDPSHKLMFRHFLRTESGRGDTIDRLAQSLALMNDFSTHQRVVTVAEVTPVLLSVYFKVVLYYCKKELISELVTAMIERIVCLYKIPSFQEETRKVLSEQLLLIFKTHPSLLVDHSRELKEFLSNMRNLRVGGEHCYVHLVWLVGEYANTSYDMRCSANELSMFFETLELVAYEAAMNLTRQAHYTVRLMLVVMATLAKLASRCQDLIPRALLCLNKIVKFSLGNVSDPTNRRLLLSRADELVNVLKMPSVAAAVLSPVPNSSEPEQVEKQRLICTLMQATSCLVSTTPNN